MNNDLADLTDSADTAGIFLFNSNSGFMLAVLPFRSSPKNLSLSAESAKSAESVFPLRHRCLLCAAMSAVGVIRHA
jgi:hypothetical protein